MTSEWEENLRAYQNFHPRAEKDDLALRTTPPRPDQFYTCICKVTVGTKINKVAFRLGQKSVLIQHTTHIIFTNFFTL